MRPDAATRFWQKVQRVETDKCWEWKAAKRAYGYGVFWLRGEYWVAPRAAWYFTHGDIPSGLCVCHICDNPGCVNPQHLFLGTMRDNSLDRERKGHNGQRRHPETIVRGESHYRAKLSRSDIPEIRALYHNGMSQTKIARRYGICQQEVSNIILHLNWTHV